MLSNFVSDFFEEGKQILLNDFVAVIPDLVGYITMFSGGLMVLSPLINRSIGQSFGIFAFFSLLGITVMEMF